MKFHKLLKVSISIFEKYKLHYWLDFGALLGIIRDGKVMSYDHDVDFGIFLYDLPILKKAQKYFRKEGYDIRFDQGWPKIWDRYSAIGEIWLWNEPLSDGYLKISNWHVPDRVEALKIPKPFFKNLPSIEWEGIQIKIPNNVEQYLEFRYGFGWRKPDKEFYENYTFKKSQKIRLEQVKIMENNFKIKKIFFDTVHKNRYASWSDWKIKNQIKLI